MVTKDETIDAYGRKGSAAYDLRKLFSELCTGCGKEYKLYTQSDDDHDPEYYTGVYILCDCGHVTRRFSLPVN